MFPKLKIIVILSLLSLYGSGCVKESVSPPPIEKPPIEEPETPVEKPEPLPEPLPEVAPEIKPEEPETPVVEEPVPEPDTLTYEPWSQSLWTTADLNLRSEPNKESELLTKMLLGEEVQTITKVSNGWFKVSYKGMEGFASGKYLTEKKDKPINTGFAPYRIHIGEKTIVYHNGGMEEAQHIIDTNRSMASTWGDVEKWSPNDNKNTYFVGHSDAAFEGIWNTPLDTEIIVTNEFGNPITYILKEIYIVDDYAVGIEDGINYFDYLVGAGTKEVITLQTCRTEDTNYILRAVLKV